MCYLDFVCFCSSIVLPQGDTDVALHNGVYICVYERIVNWDGPFYTDLVNMPFQTAKAYYQMSYAYC